MDCNQKTGRGRLWRCVFGQKQERRDLCPQGRKGKWNGQSPQDGSVCVNRTEEKEVRPFLWPFGQWMHRKLQLCGDDFGWTFVSGKVTVVLCTFALVFVVQSVIVFFRICGRTTRTLQSRSSPLAVPFPSESNQSKPSLNFTRSGTSTETSNRETLPLERLSLGR